MVSDNLKEVEDNVHQLVTSLPQLEIGCRWREFVNELVNIVA